MPRDEKRKMHGEAEFKDFKDSSIQMLNEVDFTELDFISVTIALKNGQIAQTFGGSNMDTIPNALTAVRLAAKQMEMSMEDLLGILLRAAKLDPFNDKNTKETPSAKESDDTLQGLLGNIFPGGDKEK